MRRTHLGLGISLGDPEPGLLGPSGPFAPAPIIPTEPSRASSARLWFRPESLVLAGLADGTAVSSWSDESGNNSHAAQSNASLRPTFKTNIQNGLPAVLFNGNDQILDHASIAYASEWTHFLVANLTDKTTNAINYVATAGGSTGLVLGGSNGTYGFFGQLDSATDYRRTGAAYTGWRLYTFQRERLFLNGAEATPYTTAGTVDRIDLRYLGARPDAANLGLIGYFGEFLSFASQLTDGERQGYEAYFMDKWGL